MGGFPPDFLTTSKRLKCYGFTGPDCRRRYHFGQDQPGNVASFKRKSFQKIGLRKTRAATQCAALSRRSVNRLFGIGPIEAAKFENLACVLRLGYPWYGQTALLARCASFFLRDFFLGYLFLGNLFCGLFTDHRCGSSNSSLLGYFLFGYLLFCNLLFGGFFGYLLLGDLFGYLLLRNFLFSDLLGHLLFFRHGNSSVQGFKARSYRRVPKILNSARLQNGLNIITFCASS